MKNKGRDPNIESINTSRENIMACPLAANWLDGGPACPIGSAASAKTNRQHLWAIFNQSIKFITRTVIDKNIMYNKATYIQ